MLLKFTLQEFIRDKKFQNLSDKTLESYRRTLDELEKHCLDKGIMSIEELDTSMIKDYLYGCQNRGNSASTLNHKMRNIKVFLSYCIKEGIMDISDNPTQKIKYVKEESRMICFSDHQIAQMLDYYRRIGKREKTYYAYRDYVIIITLLGTGIRLGELCNLKWDDVDFINGSITVIGKARKHRTIPMTDKLKNELTGLKCFNDQYFTSVERKSNFIFTNMNSERLTENAVQNVFKRLKNEMNFNEVRVSAHSFRHTFAKNWIMAGGDIFSLQRILGHSKLDMVKKYADLFESAVKEQNNKFNPLNRIKL